MSVGRWFEERKRDYFYRKAKEEGYPSRAAYKLIQANRRFRFLKRGDVVVDLGCAPGGWLQVSAKIIGPDGVALGVDVRGIDQKLMSRGVVFMEGDILDPELPEKITDRLGRRPDVILCDASPNVSGVWEVDHARQIHLARAALSIAKLTLKESGRFFVKVFDGPLLKEYIGEVKQHFRDLRLLKPEASRAKSSELYLLGLGFRGCGDLQLRVTCPPDLQDST
ncbi:MAG: RlmE family RNA methyltransferase [Candidatus Bathyarchaeia archaeon]